MAEELDDASLLGMKLEDLSELVMHRLSSFVGQMAPKREFEEESDIPPQAPVPINPNKAVGETMAPEGMVAGTQVTEGRLPETIPENVDQSTADARVDAVRKALARDQQLKQGGLA